MSSNPVPRPSRRLIDELESLLGDPLDAAGPFSFAEIVEHEERDEVPAGTVETLQDWGMPSHFVPQCFGGRLLNLESALGLIRSIARRNLTVSVMYGSTALGVLPIWLWGTPAQQKTLAAGVLDGDRVCFGASEADAGSDIAANGTTARLDGGGFRLSGEKWPVGNATRGRFLTVLAKGPKGHTWFFVDKDDIDAESWMPKPVVRTAGLRGHDLSGIVFTDTALPAESVIGQPGRGIIAMIKCLQITRTAIGGMSLGTMDAALRIGLDYAHERRLYGADIYQLPVVRDELAGAHLDLLIAEATAVPIARALSIVPARMSLWSSVVKYLVPVTGEEVLGHVAKVLSARSYLREGAASGVFQKIQRDHAITTIFEGTTHINLFNVAAQLSALARLAHEPMPEAQPLLRELFELGQEAPVWTPDGARLTTSTSGQDEITRSWAPAIAEVAEVVARDCGADQARDLDAVLAALDLRRSALYDGIAAQGGIDASSVAGSRAAAAHCVFHAASSVVQVWLHNRSEQPSAGWLILVLQRLLQRLDPSVLLSESYLPELESVMESCRTSRRYFGLEAMLG